ncbi:hypothetical protein N7535_001667 [Penicillium sp. DV-2018c]|nr:hypothetical protein N7535_001667 [Penicillium sp. DV-2018c]
MVLSFPVFRLPCRQVRSKCSLGRYLTLQQPILFPSIFRLLLRVVHSTGLIQHRLILPQTVLVPPDLSFPIQVVWIIGPLQCPLALLQLILFPAHLLFPQTQEAEPLLCQLVLNEALVRVCHLLLQSISSVCPLLAGLGQMAWIVLAAFNLPSESPSISPEGFMRNWHHALGEVRMTFGLLSIPDIFVFNQFLCAVSANPAAREWVASLHLPMDRPPAASIMEETYRDFLKHESRRLGLPLGTSDSQNARTKTTPTAGGTLKHHCPLQHILTEHSKEECLLLPISANEKSNENKVENTKVENKKNSGRRDWRRKKMISRHEGFSFPGRL